MNNNNYITITGDVYTAPTYSHEYRGERFYEFQLAVVRESGTADYLPILVSEDITVIEDIIPGYTVAITGDIRTYNKHEVDRSRLIIQVFAHSINYVDGSENCINEAAIIGTICKQPVYRKTPYGKEICDLLLAVNRPYGKSDYVPSIAWGRNAKRAEKLQVGQKIVVRGRLQSREYFKRIGDTEEYETRLAIELSIWSIEESEETE